MPEALRLHRTAAPLYRDVAAALIRIERDARSFEDRPIEFHRATGRADRFRYHARLR